MICMMAMATCLCWYPLSGHAQEYQAEMEGGTLTNGASIQSCSSCSNGQQVGNLGGTQNGSILLELEVADAGDYELELSYSSADPRSIFLAINEDGPIEIKCPPSGGWSVTDEVTVLVKLEKGSNLFKFDNSQSWGPNLDKAVVRMGKTVSISGIVTENGEPISGIDVEIEGYVSKNVKTGPDGAYSFLKLPSKRNYIISPKSEVYQFDPIYRNYQHLDTDLEAQNFEAGEICTDCIVEFGFGQTGKVFYNTSTGTASIQQGVNNRLENIHAEVVVNGEQISSWDYKERTIKKEAINDAFGTGSKWTVINTSDDFPKMEQVFYAYSDRKYILMQVNVSGTGIRSNFMAPLVANKGEIGNNIENQALVMPFDNDAFVRYASKPLDTGVPVESSEVTAVYENSSRNGMVIGSVNQDRWKTGIRANGRPGELTELVAYGGYSERSVTRDQKEHGYLTGSVVSSPKILVGFFEDWREGLDAYGEANLIEQPRYIFDWNEATPFGWNSWGAIQTDLNLDKAKGVVDFFDLQLPGFRSGGTAYVDLDSYWDNMVSGGLEGDYSQLIEFANYCKEKGLKPGIYWAPFVDWGKSNRKVEGSSYQYSDTWTKVNGGFHDFDGARAMDPTHPGTLKRIDLVIDKFIKCGFEMVKIDFIGHASVEADSFYESSVTTGMQAFHYGMKHLIDAMQGKMLVYVAISPNLATGPYAHSRRIACDAYADINASEYTLNSTTFGWWQSSIYDFIDADHMVFGQASFGENKARMASGIANGTLITGDDYSRTGPWTSAAKQLLQNQDLLDIVQHKKAFRPVEGNIGDGASEAFIKKIEGVPYVILINYQNERKSFDLSFERLGISPGNYALKELFKGDYRISEGNVLTATLEAKDAAIFRFEEGLINSSPQESEEKELVFPNPAHDRITVTSGKRIDHVQMIALNGQTVSKQENIMKSKVEIDLQLIQSGVYLLYVTRENGGRNVYKVIKR